MKKANHLIQKKAEVINPLTTIVMPSFNSLSIGSDVKNGGLGPFIKNKKPLL